MQWIYYCDSNNSMIKYLTSQWRIFQNYNRRFKYNYIHQLQCVCACARVSKHIFTRVWSWKSFINLLYTRIYIFVRYVFSLNLLKHILKKKTLLTVFYGRKTMKSPFPRKKILVTATDHVDFLASCSRLHDIYIFIVFVYFGVVLI